MCRLSCTVPGRVCLEFRTVPGMFLWICMISGTDFLGSRTASAMFVMILGHLRDRFSEEFLESCAAVLRPRSASGACETGPRTSPFVLAAAFCCNYQRFPCIFEWTCTVPRGILFGISDRSGHVFVDLCDLRGGFLGFRYGPAIVFYDPGSPPRPTL